MHVSTMKCSIQTELPPFFSISPRQNENSSWRLFVWFCSRLLCQFLLESFQLKYEKRRIISGIIFNVKERNYATEWWVKCYIIAEIRIIFSNYGCFAIFMIMEKSLVDTCSLFNRTHNTRILFGCVLSRDYGIRTIYRNIDTAVILYWFTFQSILITDHKHMWNLMMTTEYVKMLRKEINAFGDSSNMATA
jgi:hypothetical protein